MFLDVETQISWEVESSKVLKVDSEAPEEGDDLTRRFKGSKWINMDQW